jgi:hypothetical protein
MAQPDSTISFCNYLNVVTQRRQEHCGELRSRIPTSTLIAHFKEKFNYSLCNDITTVDCASCRQRLTKYIENSHCYCNSPQHVSNLSIPKEYDKSLGKLYSDNINVFRALCNHCLCRFVITEYVVFPNNAVSQGFRIYRELAKRERYSIRSLCKPLKDIDISYHEGGRLYDMREEIQATMEHIKFDRDDHLSMRRYKRPCPSKYNRECQCSSCTITEWWQTPIICVCKNHFNDEDLSQRCTGCLCRRLSQVAYNEIKGVSYEHINNDDAK